MSPTILAVEDSPDDAALILAALKREKGDHSVIICRDGQEAVDYLFGTGQFAGRPIPEVPRMILLDVMLPKLNGLNVLERVRADPRVRMVPVVILTGTQKPSVVAQCYRLGANSVVYKPIPLTELIATVTTLVRYWVNMNTMPRD